MLREFKQVKQERGPGSRRWFESEGLDLIVWLDERGTITGFQLCYDFGRGEHALTWKEREGLSHHMVDQGDRSPLADETPILVADGAVPWEELLQAFDSGSGSLEPELRQLVRDQLVRR